MRLLRGEAMNRRCLSKGEEAISASSLRAEDRSEAECRWLNGSSVVTLARSAASRDKRDEVPQPSSTRFDWFPSPRRAVGSLVKLEGLPS